MSLPTTFWINGLMIGGLAVGLLVTAANWFANADRSHESYQIVLALAASFVVVLAINIWQIVGIWRSAASHPSNGGSVLWARSAQFFVVVAVLVVIFVDTQFELRRITENVHLALEDRNNGPHAFHLLRGGTELEFSGVITLGTARDFARVLAASPNVKVLHLHSGGGRAADGFDMAQQVWSRKLETYVAVECSSACADIFLAGRQRWLGEHAKLGFHQPSSARGSDAGLRLASQYQREYFASRGVPADFIDKVLSTPGSSIWYPTREELLRAHVISGIAEAGKFAVSVEVAKIEAALLRVPIYASLKQAAPKVFQEFLNGLAGEIDEGATAQDIITSADNQFTELVNHLLPHASDRLVLEHTSIFVGYLDRLKTTDPESCAAMADAEGATFRADLARQFPELSKRELAFRQALIATANLDRPVPEQSQIDPDLKVVFTKMREQFGDDADLLDKDLLEPSQYKRFCEITVSFYLEAMKLPEGRGADLLRHMYNEK
jgi:hypothetical protein